MVSTSADPTPSARDVLFARGVLAGLRLWPALRLAISNNWGGPDGAEKLPWLAGAVVDAFTDPPAGELPADAEYIEDLLLQVMNDEFETVLEDGSAWIVATRAVALWEALQHGGGDAEKMVVDLEQKAGQFRGQKIQAQEEEGDDSTDGESEEDEAMDIDEPPQLIERAPQSKDEPIVDEDGFTLVKGKGKGRR